MSLCDAEMSLLVNTSELDDPVKEEKSILNLENSCSYYVCKIKLY